MSGMLTQVNRELADLSQLVHRSLVRVESGRWGAGAGTIWHPDGLVLTNAHVARHERHQVALADGRRFEARLLARDPELDLAALTVQGADLPTIEIGDSGLLRPGNWVMAFGHPWGVEGAATAGVVIGQGGQRFDPTPRSGEWPQFGRWGPRFGKRGRRSGRSRSQTDHQWLAVGLHYRPGHSGGPLVDHAGRLVGINTVMAGPNVGLAIPVQEVKDFLKRAIERV